MNEVENQELENMFEATPEDTSGIIADNISGYEHTQRKEEEGNVSDDPEFDLDSNRKVKLSQIKEWESGYMKSADYTQKTQRLAEERKQYEVELRNFQTVKQYLSDNPHVANRIREIIEGKDYSGNNFQPSNLQTNQATNYGAKDDLTARLEKIEQETAQNKLNLYIKDLKEKYKDADEKDLMGIAQERLNVNELSKKGLNPLIEAYKLKYHEDDIKKAKDSVIDGIKSKRNQATVFHSRGIANRQPAPAKKPTSYQEAMQLIENELTE